MPINPLLKGLYPTNWPDISHFVRFVRENGICQNCGRHHGTKIRQLSDGRWYDSSTRIWRNAAGELTFEPDIFEFGTSRIVNIYLAAAHIDHDPRINGNENYDRVAAWCQKCHLNYDRPFHIRTRRFLRRSRFAIGDLFLGDYQNPDFLLRP